MLVLIISRDGVVEEVGALTTKRSKWIHICKNRIASLDDGVLHVFKGCSFVVDERQSRSVVEDTWIRHKMRRTTMQQQQWIPRKKKKNQTCNMHHIALGHTAKFTSAPTALFKLAVGLLKRTDLEWILPYVVVLPFFNSLTHF